MCWLCGSYRPYDGPEKLKVGQRHLYQYQVGNNIYQANESADWENLDHFPAWEEKDPDGILFFNILILPGR